MCADGPAAAVEVDPALANLPVAGLPFEPEPSEVGDGVGSARTGPRANEARLLPFAGLGLGAARVDARRGRLLKMVVAVSESDSDASPSDAIDESGDEAHAFVVACFLNGERAKLSAARSMQRKG